MLPRRVKIGAHVYKIKMSGKKELGEDNIGLVDSEMDTIWVSRKLSRSRKVEILLHECLHAMLSGREFSDEEPIISALGESLAQLFADNPGFIRKLLEELSVSQQ